MAAVRVSPGVYMVNGKRVNASSAAAAENSMKTGGAKTPAADKPQRAGDPLKIGKVNNAQSGLRANQKVQDFQAGRNIALNNPNQVNPFGSQTTTFDENGNPTVTQTLDQDQQNIVDQDAQISQMGRNYATSLFGQQSGQQFDPNLDPRTSTGDFVADRRRQEQELQDYLGRDLDTNYAKQKADLEQTLYSRGIPLDPTNEQYKSQMKVLDDNFARQRADVRSQALQYGGAELDRSFGMNEQRRANQYSEQSGIHNQRIGDIGAYSGMGTGAQIPNFNPYQGYQYNVGNPTDIDPIYKQLQMQRQQLAQARGGSSGGSSSGQRSPIAQSPFIDV